MSTRPIVLATLMASSLPLLGQAPSSPQTLTAEQKQFFENKVRPILSSACYKCHSVADGKSKGGLVLDSRDGWLKGGDSGPAIKPGDPAGSLLVKAISYSDPDLQMPPKGEKLTPDQIEVLTQWVKMGAPDPRTEAPKAGAVRLSGLNDDARKHWAFQPVRKPELPPQRYDTWCKTPIDAFILAGLQAAGMKPSPQAPRETLIRRAYYDLIGLPPSPQEVLAFLHDQSPNAWEKVIDRLLASPHYGERWGRYWLDTARYSDTTGGERNQREEYRYAYAWTYRDYVINAFNEDKPYDQFLIEQIAADKLPNISPSDPRLAALGFLTVGQRFRNIHDNINEKIDTVTKATQALTVSCARCHDHAFDPIPTSDYYSLHGIFASTIEPKEKPLIGASATDPGVKDFELKLAKLEQENRERYFDMVEGWLRDFREKAAPYLIAATLTRNRAQTNEQVKERNRLLREHKLNEDLMRSLARLGRRDDAVFGAFAMFAELPKGQFEERAKEVLALIEQGGDRRRKVNPLVMTAFRGTNPKSMEDVAEIYAQLFSDIGHEANRYLEACRNSKAETLEGWDKDLVELLQTPVPVEPAGALTTERLLAVIERLPFRNNRGYGQFLFAQINELKLTHPSSPARAMIVKDSPQPRNSPIFIRGEAQSRGKIVPRRYLEIFSGKDAPEFSNGSGRLELAQAIASKSNPMTARVAVNRIWAHHFGDGFVRTLDDLGVQSEKPSNPQLIDWLAATFMEQGWSMKRMHKLIMMSAAYQQSSDTNPVYAQKDPENRLLWRANIRRLDFEAIRDSMLAFSGNLNPQLGGKPVNLTDEPYSYRRSVYGYIDRGSVPELMSQFDFADPDMTNSKRTTTIVPQQALFFMNSPMAIDVAMKAVDRQEFEEAKDDETRVRVLYALLYQRAPRPEEIEFAKQFVAMASDGSDEEGSPVQLVAANSRAAQAAQRSAQRRQPPRRPQQAQRRNDGRAAIRNQGEIVERRPLTPWEQFAQALLFTNEIAYVN